MYIYRTLLGFISTKNNIDVDKFYLFKDVKDAIETNNSIERGELPKNLEEFLSNFTNEEIFVIDRHLFEIVKHKGMNVKFIEYNELIARFLTNLKDFFIKIYFQKEQNYYDHIRTLSLELTRYRIRQAQKFRDKLIIQSIEAIDEIDKSINILIGRLQEWYGLHFPELYSKIGDNKIYAKLIATEPNRNKIDLELLNLLGFSKEKSNQIISSAKHSLGADFQEEDLEILKSFSQKLLDLFELRKKIEDYLEDLMMLIAPNITSITGVTIGARLIAKAGSLEKLASMPASTIQVLGAEKALFKHLKFGSKPPKHGILFQHPYVHSAPKWQRGKIARAIANKIAIAARVDLYGQKDLSKEINEELMKKVELIKLQTKPPVKKKVEKIKKHGRS